MYQEFQLNQAQWMIKSQINPQVWNRNKVWKIHVYIGLLNKYFQMENNQKLIDWKGQVMGQWWSCTIFPSLEGLLIFQSIYVFAPISKPCK